MITELSFQNFKAWSSITVSLRHITAIFGTNSSGKTSIIQMLLLLKQTKETADRQAALDLNGEVVALGTMEDVLNNHDTTKTLSFDIGFRLENELRLQAPGQTTRLVEIGTSRDFSLTSEIIMERNSAVPRMIRYSLGELAVTLEPSATKSGYELKSSGSSFSFIRNPGRRWQIPGPSQSYAFPDQARTYFANASFLSDLELKFEEQMDGVYYLGPLRERPSRDYLWARSRPTDVGQRGERTVDAILAATETGERRNLKRKTRTLSFQEMIALWLKRMGLVHAFRIEEIAEGSNRWQVKITSTEGGSEVLLTDVGFGVSQVLPVITLLYYVPEGSTVILEQPEIHLHPLAQAHLADLIINVSQRRGVQVIVESHSEHFLLRLQRRIAEGVMSAEDAALYFCDREGGKSELHDLKLDLFGNILNWPDQFMGDALGETISAERARIERHASQ